jgi:ABC-2 type transport system ATP-binding protein
MQDIESLTKRILLIGKGKILMDGQLEEIKKHFSNGKRLTVEYTGKEILPSEGLTLVKQEGQQAIFIVDTNEITVSEHYKSTGS